MTDTERISKLLEYTGLNGKKFALRIGLSYPDTIYHIVNGRNGISNKLSERIRMAYPEIERAWLLLGEGPMVREAESDQAAKPTPSGKSTGWRSTSGHSDPTEGNPTGWRSTEGQSTERRSAPLFDLDATKGCLGSILAGRKPAIDYVSFPGLPQCDGAVYMRGDSMYPLLRAGDILIYKTLNNFNSLIRGEMYLLSFTLDGDEYTTVKYLNRAEQHPDRLVLSSHNPNHSSIEIAQEDVTAIALVKASIRSHSMI